MPTIIQPKLPRVEFYPGKPGSPYVPSNGTEGEFFFSMWCEECAHDKEMNGTCWREGREADEGDWCEIIGRSFRSDEPLPEWVYGEDGQPKCLMFTPVGNGIAPPRCDHTVDMFGEEPQPLAR